MYFQMLPLLLICLLMGLEIKRLFLEFQREVRVVQLYYKPYKLRNTSERTFKCAGDS